jgi:hypothetical protein
LQQDKRRKGRRRKRSKRGYVKRIELASLIINYVESPKRKALF